MLNFANVDFKFVTRSFEIHINHFDLLATVHGLCKVVNCQLVLGFLLHSEADLFRHLQMKIILFQRVLFFIFQCFIDFSYQSDAVGVLAVVTQQFAREFIFVSELAKVARVLPNELD